MALRTVKRTKGYKIQHNGSSTYFVVDSTGTTIHRTDTLRKANNRLNSTLKSAGLSGSKNKALGLSGG